MPFAIKVVHKSLGEAIYTIACEALDKNNPDKTSIFIEHNGEIKEVSKHLVSPKELTWIESDEN